MFLDALRRNSDVEALYASASREFDEHPDPQHPTKVFWKQEERQGRLKRKRLDLFLFRFVTSQTADSFTIEQLYARFKQWWGSQAALEPALGELQASSKVYSTLLQPDRTTRFGEFAHRIRVLDTTTAYPQVI